MPAMALGAAGESAPDANLFEQSQFGKKGVKRHQPFQTNLLFFRFYTVTIVSAVCSQRSTCQAHGMFDDVSQCLWDTPCAFELPRLHVPSIRSASSQEPSSSAVTNSLLSEATACCVCCVPGRSSWLPVFMQLAALALMSRPRASHSGCQSCHKWELWACLQ